MRYLLTILIFCSCSFVLQAQEEAKEEEEKEKVSIAPVLFAGVTAGGNVDRGNFAYTDGWTANGGLMWKKSKRVAMGLTGGVEKLKDVTFLPVGLMITGFTSKKDESTVFGLQSGYAHGFSEEMYSLINYKFRGGLFFQPFIGYKTELNKRDLMLTIGYKHQFAELLFTPAEGKTFSENHSYHLLSFRAGILF